MKLCSQLGSRGTGANGCVSEGCVAVVSDGSVVTVSDGSVAVVPEGSVAVVPEGSVAVVPVAFNSSSEGRGIVVCIAAVTSCACLICVHIRTRYGFAAPSGAG